uniref:Uncharacterized protein n=1 Tax=Rhizophora mucronata TaxID=61149 RepID=A0A2P2NB12_RHIMU
MQERQNPKTFAWSVCDSVIAATATLLMKLKNYWPCIPIICSPFLIGKIRLNKHRI